MSTSAQPRQHPGTTGGVQALLYHASQVSEIARFLNGQQGDPRLQNTAAGAGVTVDQLIQQIRRRPVRSRISLDTALSEVPSDPLDVLYSLLLETPGRAQLLVSRSLLDDDAGQRQVSAHAGEGTAVYVAGEAIPRMALIDGAVAVLGDFSARPTVVRDRSVVRTLEALFDTVWEGAVDSGVFARADTSLRWDIEQGGPLAQVLPLLGSGWTDTAAARELGWSVRTYRRHVADLMRRVEARSRFQAGMRTALLRLDPRSD
ncbi:helix-turn-helix transcriptional regulator [Actinacidiphila sp. ITFR-21]|uniref:helix-turn-helix transcriptional regulator n=1 Tax=Actinacidiphila sp. ITFR-21 TaxID=3075199 RepID=UPI00288C21EE|nr:hypothetical protein [Streptomyces sp. ITFR-21]WNI18885.1 hypothetical protein RLT57_27400 [Streptomyces sp. ITFR-21]